jgi:iron complex transport system ATP-binding protein
MLSNSNSLFMRNVSFSYFNGLVLRDIDLNIADGEMVGLIGPNGCGKTTLLKLACGVLSPIRGEVSLGGISLKKLSRKQVAQHVAVVPQYFNIPFAFTVAEVVLLGRTPFVSAISGETRRDHEMSAMALGLAGINHLENRYFNDLSGGERQKVILAMALAQEPKLLLLDEPTTHLDISHQIEILELVKSLNREQGITVIAAMHDLNLAALFFDRLVLLKEGAIFADGSPREVLTESSILNAFSASVKVSQHPVTSVPHIVVLPREVTTKNHVAS